MEDIEQRVLAVCHDRDHGSRWFVREAVSIMHDLTSDTTCPAEESMQRLHITAQKLEQAHAAMAALARAVRRILKTRGGPAEIATETSRFLQYIAPPTE